jgi:hypothetical protein
VRFIGGGNFSGEAERSRFVVPLQGTESDCPVTQGGASLAPASVSGILSGFFCGPNLPVFVLGVRCRTEPGYSNFIEPSREFGRYTH